MRATGEVLWQIGEVLLMSLYVLVPAITAYALAGVVAWLAGGARRAICRHLRR